MLTLYKEKNRGVTYRRESYMYGGGWYSYEVGIQPGTIRMINGILSEAWSVTVRGCFRKPRVLWKAVEPDSIRKVDINEKPST